MGQFSGVADVRNRIKGLSEPNIITGGNLADRLYGNATIDTITGGAGNDYIDGKGDNDTLEGGLGNDTLMGGKGWDTYTIATGDGNDTILLTNNNGRDTLNANFLTNTTSGVFIKRGNDLIVAEGTVNLTGDADSDGDDAEDLATEIAGIQALTSAVTRRAGMRSIAKNLTTSATVKNYFNSGDIGFYAVGGFSIVTQTIMTTLVDYNTGLKYFNQAASNADIVRGTSTGDIIIASKDGQILKGGKGEDTYFIGTNKDVIVDDISGGSYQQIVFGDNNGGVGGTYVYTREGNDAKITFDDGSGGDIDASVIIKNYYSRNGAQTDRIGCDLDGDMSSGVSLNARDYIGWRITDKIGAQTSTGRSLRGTIANDVLTLDAGGQTAYGYAGDDQYTVTAGKAVIVDSSNGSTKGDALYADHLATQNDGVYIKKGNDLIILDGGDAVTGYADADTAVTDLPNLSAAQRRIVVKNLVAMSDSITIRNYFGNGEIETIKAFNNSSISGQTIMTELINYNTGLNFFNQDANTRVVRGTRTPDYIVATASNQKLYGGLGDDTYAIGGGFTDVEIYDIDGSDKIYLTQAVLGPFIGSTDSYSFEKVGNDLKVSITDAGNGDSSVIIKHYYLNDKYKIERLEDIFMTSMDIPTDEMLRIVGESDTNNGLTGGGGDDTITGGAISFNDYVSGGEGSDTYEFLSGDKNDVIIETDTLGAADVDKAVFLGADFSLASSSITLTRDGNNLDVLIDEGDGVTSNMTVADYYAGGTSQIEVIEDGYGNSYNLSTSTVSADFNAILTFTNAGTALYSNESDIIYGSSGADLLDADLGDDYIDVGDGNDAVWCNDGNDTILAGPGTDAASLGAGNDIVLYDLDSGNFGGADTITDFTIGEDVVRFTTSANDTLGLDFRNHIAIRDTGAGLEIGYGWNEASQDYANTITFNAYDDASVLTDNVIEFVTSDGTTALTAAEITAILTDIAADGDAPGTLAAIHNDIDAGAGGNDGQLLVDSINAAW